MHMQPKKTPYIVSWKPMMLPAGLRFPGTEAPQKPGEGFALQTSIRLGPGG